MRGYVAALGERYRPILIDARGDGLSDKPQDPEAYRIALYAADVVAILDDLHIARAYFLDYSAGGMHARERCLSLILGDDGAIVLRAAGDPAARKTIALVRRDIDAWADTWGNAPPEVVERPRRNDPLALIANRALFERRGFAAALPQFDRPCLIYAGETDDVHAEARAAAAIVPRARFVSFPDLNHGLCFSRSDLVLPHIIAFLAEVDPRGDGQRGRSSTR
jgi:pimeloyl-ACP methyl ester carboxylesterase